MPELIHYFQPWCSEVAILMHYFLLAFFSWMLCEVVLHYISMAQIVGGVQYNVWKYSYVFLSKGLLQSIVIVLDIQYFSPEYGLRNSAAFREH